MSILHTFTEVDRWKEFPVCIKRLCVWSVRSPTHRNKKQIKLHIWKLNVQLVTGEQVAEKTYFLSHTSTCISSMTIWEEENKRGRNSRFQTKEKSKVKSADIYWKTIWCTEQYSVYRLNRNKKEVNPENTLRTMKGFSDWQCPFRKLSLPN